MEKKAKGRPKKIEKRPVVSVLKSMEVEKSEIFPIVQIEYVRTAIVRIQIQNRKLKYSTKLLDNSVQVTRVK